MLNRLFYLDASLKPLNRLYILSPVLILLVLGMDSIWMQQFISWGQYISLLIVILFLWLTMRLLSPERQLIVASFIVIAIIGECLFSLVFRLYEYRLRNIPIYVPLAHPILLVMVWVLVDMAWFRKYDSVIAPWLASIHVIIIVAVVVFLGDTLSLTFGVLGLYLFRRRRFNLIYGLMGWIVLIVEIAGTQLGCWHWASASAAGWLQATNPPYGAFLGYVAADIASIKLARWISARWFPAIKIIAP